MKLPLVNFDCIHFHGDRPCYVNKNYAVFCSECSLYEKDETIIDEFPGVGPPDFPEKPEGFKKIIIIKLDAVGDVLRTTSVLPSLKQKYDDCSITWITKERSFEVLKDNEMIDEIYFDTDELEHIYNDDFDIAINLDSGKESCEIMSRLVSKERFGYHIMNSKPFPVNELANEWYLMGVDDNAKKKNSKTYHRIIHDICGLEYTGSCPHLGISSGIIKKATAFNSKFGLGKYDEFIVVNLGGGNRWQYKKWTDQGYISLINKLLDHKPETAIGIIAGDEDRDFYDTISSAIEQNSRLIRLGHNNTIEDFISLIYLSDKVFTSDSLAMHISTALKKYTVVITGPTSFTELDVFGSGVIIHSGKVECLCCYLNKCDKTVNCMNTVDAADVIKYL